MNRDDEKEELENFLLDRLLENVNAENGTEYTREDIGPDDVDFGIDDELFDNTEMLDDTVRKFYAEFPKKDVKVISKFLSIFFASGDEKDSDDDDLRDRNFTRNDVDIILRYLKKVEERNSENENIDWNIFVFTDEEKDVLADFLDTFNNPYIKKETAVRKFGVDEVFLIVRFLSITGIPDAVENFSGEKRPVFDRLREYIIKTDSDPEGENSKIDEPKFTADEAAVIATFLKLPKTKDDSEEEDSGAEDAASETLPSDGGNGENGGASCSSDEDGDDAGEAGSSDDGSSDFFGGGNGAAGGKASGDGGSFEQSGGSSEKNAAKSRADDRNESSIVPVEQMLPNRLHLIGLNMHPIFPGTFSPIMLTVPDDINTLEAAYEAGGFIGLVLERSESDAETIEDLYDVGTVARIIKKINSPDGGLNVFVSTIKRFRIRKTLSRKNPIVAAVEYLDEYEDTSFEAKALTRAIISEMKEISENNPFFTEEIRLNMVNIDNPGRIADFAASVLSIDKKEQQKILEQLNVRARMEQVLVFIKKEQELLRIQKKVQNELEERVEKNQREYFLREEMKTIQDELGIGADGGGNDYTKFKTKIESLGFEGEIKESLDSELEKFKLMDPSSSEYFVSWNYLDLVCSLPWKEEKTDELDLTKAYKILEKDHYGLDDVKKRILEYLSVRKLKNDSKGSIMILVGPPGVGKTSIGHSIAKAMNKPFYRFSVGGMHDEAEIKGHRRTYVGSMPGKIIQGLKITKTRSPVFMIDEIDKMGTSNQGDPASALLEVLDPEQNFSFRDNFLNIPFDVSDVFFILTANTLDSIPEPLLDRAEIIQLSGYIDQEKLEIARKYLIPKNLVKNGLAKNQVRFTKAALKRIAEEYARESGVRNFEKCIDRINRKLVTQELAGIPADLKRLKDAKSIVNGSAESVKEKTFSVDACDLEKYLGKPLFDESEIKKADIPGTCIGLAWTSMGGDTLLIETISFPDSKGGLVLTGQMGDVMTESSQIAFNWVKQFAIQNKIKDPSWFEKNVVHLHIPEGATPKDGPSAGITMATTFMSLLTGRTVKPNVAMTGELDLTGAVMPIGGLREKTVAAKRNGVKTIFIPKANEKDLDEIPDIVKEGIKFIPVRHAMEVMKEVFQPRKKQRLEDVDYGF